MVYMNSIFQVLAHPRPDTRRSDPFLQKTPIQFLRPRLTALIPSIQLHLENGLSVLQNEFMALFV